MRIRSVKPEFWGDELVASWPAITRLAYIALWNEADDEGRLRANPTYLKSRLFPYEPSLDLDEVLQPIVDAGKMITYESGGQAFAYLPKFRVHQKINRPGPSKLPPPKEFTEDSLSIHGEVTEDSLSIHGGNREQGAGNREQVKDSLSADVEVVVAEWQRCGLKQIRKLTDARRKKLRTRLGDSDWRREWRRALSQAAESAFCRGEGNRGWVADFDWFLLPDTVTKILEGKYDKREPTVPDPARTNSVRA